MKYKKSLYLCIFGILMIIYSVFFFIHKRKYHLFENVTIDLSLIYVCYYVCAASFIFNYVYNLITDDGKPIKVVKKVVEEEDKRDREFEKGIYKDASNNIYKAVKVVDYYEGNTKMVVLKSNGKTLMVSLEEFLSYTLINNEVVYKFKKVK